MIESFLAKAKLMLNTMRVLEIVFIVCISVPYYICMNTKMLENTWKIMKTNCKIPRLLELYLQVNLC